MSLLSRTVLAAIPGVSRVKDPEIRAALQAIKETLDTFRGTAPNAEKLDEVITKRELYEAGLIDVIRQGQRLHFGGNNNTGIIPNTGGPTGPTPPAVVVPPAPTDLQAFGSLGVILLSWGGFFYAGHAYTEVWRASVDDLGQAVLIGTSQGQSGLYSDVTGTASAYYYWVRFVSNTPRTGPYNAVAGTFGETGDDPGYLLSILTEQITASQLHASLNSLIGEIPEIITNIGAIETNLGTIVSDILSADVSEFTSINSEFTKYREQSDNLIVNGSFEFGLAPHSMLPPAFLFEVVEDSGAVTGSHVLQVDFTTPASNQTLIMNGPESSHSVHARAVEGDIFRASFYIRQKSGTANQNQIRLDYYNAAGQQLIAGFNFTSVTPNSNWQRVVVEGTAPANTHYAIVRIIAQYTGNAGIVQFDDVRLTRRDSLLIAEVEANATALTALTTTVSTQGGQISSNSSAITAVQSSLSTLVDDVDANATAISTLNSTVATQGGLISANSTAITGVQANISSLQDQLNDIQDVPEFDSGNTYETGDLVVYDDSLYRAIQDMDTPPSPLPTDTDYWELIGDYSSLGEAVSALSSAISALEADVTELETGIATNASAITTINSTLTTQGGLITANADSITANSNAIGVLDTRVTQTESGITTNANAITTINSTLASQASDISVNAGAINSLTTRVTDAEGDIVSQAGLLTQISSRVTQVENGPPRLYFGFDTGLEGFGGGASTRGWQAGGYLRWTTTGTSPTLTRSLAAPERFQGADYTKVRARVRRISGTGTWEGNLYYSTSGHGASNSFRKQIPAPANPDVWNILEFDMADLTVGGNDWIANEIIALRIDLVSDAGSVWDFDWISVSQDSVTALSATVQVQGSTLATLSGDLYAEHTIKVQTLGGEPVIAGIGLNAQPGGSTIGLIADRIYFAHPSTGADITPFVYDSGVVHIDTASIINLTATNFVGGTINADTVTAGLSITSPTIIGGKVRNTADTNFVDLGASGASPFIRSASGVELRANGTFTLGDPDGSRISWNGSALEVIGNVFGSRFRTSFNDSGERIDLNRDGNARIHWYSGAENLRVSIGAIAENVPELGNINSWATFGVLPNSTTGLIGKTTSGSGVLGWATTGIGVSGHSDNGVAGVLGSTYGTNDAGVRGVDLSGNGYGLVGAGVRSQLRLVQTNFYSGLALPSAEPGAFHSGTDGLFYKNSGTGTTGWGVIPTPDLRLDGREDGSFAMAGNTSHVFPAGLWHVWFPNPANIVLELRVNGGWYAHSGITQGPDARAVFQFVSNGNNVRARTTSVGISRTVQYTRY